MIEIPNLKTLKAFENKRIILFGAGVSGQATNQILRYFGYKVEAFCVDSLELCATKIEDVTVISTEELMSIAKEPDVQILLCLFVDTEVRERLSQQLQENSDKILSITGGHVRCSFMPRYYLEEILTNKALPMSAAQYKTLVEGGTERQIFEFQIQESNMPIFLCLPPKTGDHTLMYTFEKVKKEQADEVQFLNLWHSSYRYPKIISGREAQKIKIVTGVREPISQNLSELYQVVSASNEKAILQILTMLEETQKADWEAVLNELEDVYVTNRNDAQVLFDHYIKREIYPKENSFQGSCSTLFIQKFMELFCEDILNIYEHPFNKEKGYAIMKQGNVEVFIYQLEKMNDIIPEFSEWLGVPFDAWVRGNEASDKWISDSYKQAQKEIEITQEYFDRCFNEPYVKHCYSEADIEKFKARWRPHIKK